MRDLRFQHFPIGIGVSNRRRAATGGHQEAVTNHTTTHSCQLVASQEAVASAKLESVRGLGEAQVRLSNYTAAAHCSTLQHTATHCSTLTAWARRR